MKLIKKKKKKGVGGSFIILFCLKNDYYNFQKYKL